MKLRDKCKTVTFSKHSVQQMFSRSITKSDIISSLEQGEVIIEYLDEKPLPCYLILNYIYERPVHIVVAVDKINEGCIIVTAYIPDVTSWEKDFKSKRKSK